MSEGNTRTYGGREPTDQEILDILAEECAEVIHIISKIRRFGLDEVYPKLGVSNRDRLLEEMFDVHTMLDWCYDKDIVIVPGAMTYKAHSKTKKEKVRRYCVYGDTTRD